MYKRIITSDTNDWMIAIPALGERKEIYLPLAEQISNYNWLLLDLPGSNGEQLDDYSIPAFCSRIKSLLDELHITEAHLMGNSLGTWIIQAFITRFPSYVKSLTLLDGGHFFHGELGEPWEDKNLETGTFDIEDIKKALKDFAYSMPNLEEECYKQIQNYMLDNYVLGVNGYKHHFHPQAYNSLARELEKTNYCLTDFTVPTHLIIAGASAWEQSLEKAKILAEKHSNIKLTIIENGQHYLPLTNTNALKNTLLSNN